MEIVRTEGREAGRGFYREGRERWGGMKWRPGIGQRKSIDQVMYKYGVLHGIDGRLRLE